MKNILSILSLLLLVNFISACSKGGLGGDNTLIIYPYHHTWQVFSTSVYIKYNAKILPDTIPSAYDDGKASVDYSNPHATFTGLKKGDYYIYAIGFDSAVGREVEGGYPIKITKNSGETDFDLPITEPSPPKPH